MVTCPWCGTSYTTFQSNCKNCGGPLPAQGAIWSESGEELLFPPPPAPRSISTGYLWKLMSTDGWSIAAFTFLILGVIFGVVGLGLTAGIVTAIVGIPFLLMGIAFLAGGAGLGVWRYNEKHKIVDVLRIGETVMGKIGDVQENLFVAINNRHPWNIDYYFTYNGKTHSGRVTTLNRPGISMQPGKPVYVLYMQGNPALNTIYPHP